MASPQPSSQASPFVLPCWIEPSFQIFLQAALLFLLFGLGMASDSILHSGYA